MLRNAVSTVLVTLVAVLAVLLAGVRLVGVQVYTVLSGSMEPAYHVGSVIYVKNVDCHTLREGDVITFAAADGIVATHRIAEVVQEENGLRFRTKGDANQTADAALVDSRNVLGTPVFTIPYLGYLAAYIQSPPGRYYAIAFSAVLLVLTLLPDGKKKNK